MPAAIKVLIADDEPLFRDALSIQIQSEHDMMLVGAAGNGLEALQLVEQHQPDLVLMDVRMPVMDGIECIKKIRELHYEGVILILTTFNEEQYIIEGLGNGADGYLLKGLEFHKLSAMMRDAVNGQYSLPAEVAIKLVQYVSKKDLLLREDILSSLAKSHALSERERAILPMLLNRLSNREIAEKLLVTEDTVKNDLTAIYGKLGVRNRHEAMQYLQNEVR